MNVNIFVSKFELLFVAGRQGTFTWDFYFRGD
jgi:hypothetical protein